jgi:putative flippase GtrA
MTTEYLARAARFATVGVINTSVDVGLYSVAVIVLGWHPVLANTVSYSTGVLCSFALNSTWTFGDCNRSQPIRQFVRFVGINAVMLLVGNVIIAGLLAVIPALAAKGLATAVGFALNYNLMRRFVFAR